MTKKNFPIAVIDSGLGGLTVVRALRKVLPLEDLIYFGDTARLPYGTKSQATITGFVRQIIKYLLPMSPKHIVIACNTATALTLPEITSEFPGVSISGVIDPGAKAAVAAGGHKKTPIIGVIATPATIRSKAYERAILRRRRHAHVLLRPAPLLVPIIEEGRDCDDPVVDLVLRQYLAPLLEKKLDVLVLGCTHYPMLKPAIAKIAGPDVRLIDSAEQCAQDVARRLRMKQLLRVADEPIVQPPAGIIIQTMGTIQSFVTDDAARFAVLGSRFLAMPLPMPKCVDLDSLSQSRQEDVELRATG
jgi:glutamate racemase